MLFKRPSQQRFGLIDAQRRVCCSKEPARTVMCATAVSAVAVKSLLCEELHIMIEAVQ
jgi:hypothetical protein